MIFARSRRSSVLVAGCGLLVATIFGGVSAVIFAEHGPDVAGLALGIGAGLGLGLLTWALVQLRSWPPCRLAFFRDRLVIVAGKVEQHALWDRIETASLALPVEWTGSRWPEVRISDRLTITLRRGRPVVLRPADFGLAPTGCRDLILKLRDESELRSRLPEFDSALDLSDRPVYAGELITPRL